MTSQSRNIYMPDELWERMRHAAIAESVKRGEVVSPSQYIREAIERRLKSEKPKKGAP